MNLLHVTVVGKHASSDSASPSRKAGGDRDIEIEEGLKFPVVPKKVDAGGDVVQLGGNNQSMPPASVMTRLIVIMVWRKLIRNPNTYSSVIGLIWSFVSFR